jgi:NADH:ubiquinone reductase (H+-translocating)
MAEIGKRTGVAILFGLKFQGFAAWWLWRTFYLANMPTTRKKLKVMVDWIMDLLFKPDVVRIRRRSLSGKKTRIRTKEG